MLTRAVHDKAVRAGEVADDAGEAERAGARDEGHGGREGLHLLEGVPQGEDEVHVQGWNKNTCCHSPYKWRSYFFFFFLRWTTLSQSGCTTEFNDLPPTLAARGPIVPQAHHFHFVAKKKIQFLHHPILHPLRNENKSETPM